MCYYHILQTHVLDRMAWLVFLRSSVKRRQRTVEKFRKEGMLAYPNHDFGKHTIALL